MFFFHKKKSHHRTHQHRRSLKAGFTLFEMVISITIFVLVAAVLLARNSQFQGTTVLTNLTYELALEIRQAQVYGVDVQACTSSEGCNQGGIQPETFTHAYGVHYPDVNGQPSTFDLYVDTNDNFYYDPYNIATNPGGDPDTPIQVSSFPSAQYLVKRACTTSSAAQTNYCDNPPATPVNGYSNFQILSLNISFKRPQPNAIIYAEESVPNSNPALVQYQGNPLAMDSATICLTTTTGQVREVDVSAVGQISVNESAGPLCTAQ